MSIFMVLVLTDRTRLTRSIGNQLLAPMPATQTNVDCGHNPDGVWPRRQYPAAVDPNPSATHPIPVTRHPYVSWAGRGSRGIYNNRSWGRGWDTADGNPEVDMCGEDEARRQQKADNDKRSDSIHR
jgi:hypothetical protein